MMQIGTTTKMHIMSMAIICYFWHRISSAQATLITQNNNINTKYTNTLAKLWHQNEYRWNVCKKNQQTDGTPSLFGTAIPHRLDLTCQRHHHISPHNIDLQWFFPTKRIQWPCLYAQVRIKKHCSSTIMLPVKLLSRKLPQTAVAQSYNKNSVVMKSLNNFVARALAYP